MKFSLATIAYVFALLAAGMAAFGGLLGIIAWLVVLGYWWSDPRWPKTLLEMLVIVMMIGLLLGLLLPTVHTARESSRVMACGSSIRSIALALQAYQRTHGHLPPAGVANTRAMSWRVAILPWLENRDRYETYRRDEPWNSAANMRVTSQPLWSYECPSDPPLTATTHQTNYFAIVDARTVWGRGGVPPAITDAAGQTIMLIEAAGLGVPWAEPRDLSFDEAVAILTGRALNQVPHVRRPGPGFFQKGYGKNQTGVHVAFADGEIGYISPPISTELATAMLTANGGEKLDRYVTEQFGVPQTDYGKVYAFVVFVLLALLPGVARACRRRKASEGSPAS